MWVWWRLKRPSFSFCTSKLDWLLHGRLNLMKVSVVPLCRNDHFFSPSVPWRHTFVSKKLYKNSSLKNTFGFSSQSYKKWLKFKKFEFIFFLWVIPAIASTFFGTAAKLRMLRHDEFIQFFTERETWFFGATFNLMLIREILKADIDKTWFLER